MTTINDLSVALSVSSDDKLPLWQNANGVTRALPVSVLDARYVTQDDIAQLAADAKVEKFISSTLPNPDNLPTFIAGTTFSLTLANQYFSIDNIETFFDGTYQGLDGGSLIGFGLTFPDPIPVGTEMVYVRGGAVRLIGAPSDDTVSTSSIKDGAVTGAKLAGSAVTDASVKANANIDSSKLSFLQAGAAAARRPIQDRLRDTLSVKDFGVKGDGTTDDTATINAALAYVATAGGTLFFPQGNYLVTGNGLLLDQSALVDADLKHVCISGAGEGATQITYLGTGTAFSYLGAQPNGMNSYFTLENMRFLGTSQTNSSIGISMNLVSTMVMRNVATRVFGTGFVGTDILQSGFYDCAFGVNGGGLTMNFGVFSPPNAILFCNCEFIGNLNYGALIGDCTTVKFLGGAVQNNGKTGTATFRYGVAIITDNGAVGLNGALAASFDTVYFEDNAFEADIWFQAGGSTDGSTALTVTGCTFNRLTSAANQFVNYNIRVDVSTPFKTKLVVVGNGFQGFATYVPSNTTPYIFVSDPFNAAIDTVDLGNLYGSSVEKPVFIGPTKGDIAMVSQYCAFDGTQATPSTIGSLNTALITKNGTGDYTVTFGKPGSKSVYPVNFSLGGAGFCQIISTSAANYRFKTLNPSQAATDFAYVSASCFGNGDVT